jgi:hypothetical protein
MAPNKKAPMGSVHRCSKTKVIDDLDHAVNGNGKKGMKVEIAEHTIQLNEIKSTVDKVDEKIDSLIVKVDEAKVAAHTSKLALEEYKREAVLVEDVKKQLKDEQDKAVEKEIKLYSMKLQRKMFVIALVTVIITCIGFATKMLSSEKEVASLKTEMTK